MSSYNSSSTSVVPNRANFIWSSEAGIVDDFMSLPNKKSVLTLKYEAKLLAYFL